MEADTIAKLSEALADLIKAYEDIQLENMELKEELESSKSDNITLKGRIDGLNNNKSKQSIQLTDMLSKVEDILTTTKKEGLKSPNAVENTEETNSIIKQEETPNLKVTNEKIDLNKMQDFLNGIKS